MKKKKMRSEKTGGKSEKLIENLLIDFGYEHIPWKTMKQILGNSHINGNVLNANPIKYYAKNIPLGVCLYHNMNKREEFLIYNSELYPDGCVLTVKWQQVSGTGYEKAPYLLLNVLNHYKFPSIIIWDGNFKVAGVKAAYEYLKELCEGNGVCPICGGSIDNKKLLGVYTHSEFLQFANQGGI